MVGILRLAFWSALAFTLYMALDARPPVLVASDRLAHILAFSVLTALACLAHPRVPVLPIALLMFGLGIAIELLQLIPALHRDASIYDWLADAAAIASVAALVAGTRRLRRLGADRG